MSLKHLEEARELRAQNHHGKYYSKSQRAKKFALTIEKGEPCPNCGHDKFVSNVNSGKHCTKCKRKLQ